MKTNGKLIIFEGIDRVGKSTLSDALWRQLKNDGVDVVKFSYPGKEDGTLGKLIYDIHHNPQKFSVTSINPLSLQILHIAAHVDLLKNTLIPAYEKGKTVILDRYWWSTIAYGIGNDVAENLLWKITQVERDLTDKISNKMFFYITRNSESGYDVEKERKILRAYDDIFESSNEGKKIKIDNNDDIQKVLGAILQKVKGMV